MATHASEATSRNGVPAQGETKLWHSQAHMPTVKYSERVIVRGEGAYVWTDEGHRLLDLPASLWYCNVGHGRRQIAEAVVEQMSKIEAYSTFQRYATPRRSSSPRGSRRWRRSTTLASVSPVADRTRSTSPASSRVATGMSSDGPTSA
jgi:hypothetical protein